MYRQLEPKSTHLCDSCEKLVKDKRNKMADILDGHLSCQFDYQDALDYVDRIVDILIGEQKEINEKIQ